MQRARWCLVVVFALIAAAACTSQTSNDTSTAKPAANNSTVGITADTVKVSLIVADLGMLSTQHLAPDLGDLTKVAQATVDDINSSGGVAGGRKIALTAHTLPNAPLASAQALQDVCTKATEEDQPLAVVVGVAIPVPVVQCVSDSHTQLGIAMDSWQKSVYDGAQGRLFSLGTPISVSIERSYSFFPQLMQSTHALDGKTVGILNSDQPEDRPAAATALKAALEKLGVKVAAEATAPYPEGSQTCTQADVAVQKLKAANVNFVFLLAQNLCGAALVKAAQDAGFKPQWATLGNNVTDTVAQFYAPAKANYDGAIGVGSVFPQATQEAKDCISMLERRTGIHYTEGSDPFGAAAVTCMQVRALANALNKAKTPLTQGTVIAALEAMSSIPVSAGPPGSLSAAKHDAGDYVFLEKYSAAQGKFVPVDTTPQRVP